MSTESHIEWTDATWNPVAGCTAVSPGCANCYAATMTRRLEAMANADYAGLTNDRHFNGTVRCLPHKLDVPLKWKKPRRIFVNSMSDLFHEDVPFEFVDRVFAVMNATTYKLPLRDPFPHWHTYQLLTKRPERAAEYLESRRPENYKPGHHPIFAAGRGDGAPLRGHGTEIMNAGGVLSWPLRNLWIGTSVENQAAADVRIPHMLRCPAVVRFLSCEPLIGPVDLSIHPHPLGLYTEAKGCVYRSMPGGDVIAIGTGGLRKFSAKPRIHWVIAGGESGPGARPCDIAWIRSIIAQCKRAGVPCFVKQIGASPREDEPEDGEEWPVPLIYGNSGFCEPVLGDRKGGDWDEWPEDLRIREFPTAEGTVACSAS